MKSIKSITALSLAVSGIVSAAASVICFCNPGGAAPLQGNVQHEDAVPLSADAFKDAELGQLLPAGAGFSDTVEPIKGSLKVHKLFSDYTPPAEDKEDIWYQIPVWRAGLFHRERQTDHTMFGDVETVSKVDHLYGMQVDRKGGIWHHVSWPRITKLECDGYSEYKVIDRYEPVAVGPDQFCVKVFSTNIDVDDKTGKIIRLSRQEEFDRYFPGGPNMARGFCLIQGFSVHGRTNTTVERTTVEERRIQPFSVLNSFRGKDLKASFKRYLQANQLPDLVPLD